MSELRSILDHVRSIDTRALTNQELADQIGEVAHVRDQMDVFLSEFTTELAERHGHQDLGYSSPTALLIDQTGMSPGRARQVVAMGAAVEKAPHAHAAWRDGRLSTDQARHLFRAAEAVPDEYPVAEERLVEIVEGLDAVDTGKAVEYWRQSVDGPGEIDPDIQFARRGLSISHTSGGMRRVDGWLTATAGEALEAAVGALTPPRHEDDVRTPRQRRHDALEDLCRDWLDNGTTPTIGGEKPHITLHADIPALQAIAGGTHETENGDIVDIDTLRRIACDSSITRIVLGPDSEIIDVGRKTRVWSPAQRRAIIARDRHCQGRGCRRDGRHCDIHHTTHWADGGETTIANGTLLCRPCHTREHLTERLRRRIRSRS